MRVCNYIRTPNSYRMSSICRQVAHFAAQRVRSITHIPAPVGTSQLKALPIAYAHQHRDSDADIQEMMSEMALRHAYPWAFARAKQNPKIVIKPVVIDADELTYLHEMAVKQSQCYSK